MDRSGEPLALSLEAQSVYARPHRIHDPTNVSRALAKILNLDAVEVKQKITADKPFVWTPVPSRSATAGRRTGVAATATHVSTPTVTAGVTIDRPRPTATVHEKEIETAGADLLLYSGHVNHAVFLTYLEEVGTSG